MGWESKDFTAVYEMGFFSTIPILQIFFLDFWVFEGPYPLCEFYTRAKGWSKNPRNKEEIH